MPTEGTIVKAKDIGKTGGRYIYTACQECGSPRWVAWAKHNRNPMICKKCSDFKKGIKRRITFLWEGNPSWKGYGRYTLVSGYVDILLRPDDFFLPMANAKRRVKEHRLVMAEHLGRCLESWEIVHHRNGIRDDNRLENLELLGSQSEHFPSIKVKQELQRQAKTINDLQSRVTLLEVENLLLRVQTKSEEMV